MSILAGRLAATEGSYFLRESKQAVGRLSNKKTPPQSQNPNRIESESADVLPEILRHSIPLKGIPPESDPSLSTTSKWLLKSNPSSNSVSPDALNPFRAYVSLPQATLGPKRWQVPDEQPTVSASKANELRKDRYSQQIDSRKLKALVVGYSQIGKAFAVATTIVFGGGAAVFVYTAHKLQIENANDIRTKGKDLIQPGANILREQIVPLRTWVENMSRKWHIEGGGEVKEKSIVKELSKILGPRTTG
ncbi:uncharacterized protein LOC109822540 [Asparagus officinalis]|uniref:uncharacterized protein LOC109822540 n=1 Tax=Asparagus officinalis TaxID=4686 RepID=UPI00098E07DB|nr:uncharacterized protein LOC109822540 [Asparagus officinalis]